MFERARAMFAALALLATCAMAAGNAPTLGAFATQKRASLSPQLTSWVNTQGRTVATSPGAPNLDALHASAAAALTPAKATPVNVNELVLLALMQAVNAANQDLKNLALQIQKSNAQAGALSGQQSDIAAQAATLAAPDSLQMDPVAIGAEMKKIEAMQEEVRNKRQMDKTAFQNFDQKANQLYNMLSSVVKTLNEMRGIGAGNRSGL